MKKMHRIENNIGISLYKYNIDPGLKGKCLKNSKIPFSDLKERADEDAIL